MKEKIKRILFKLALLLVIWLFVILVAMIVDLSGTVSLTIRWGSLVGFIMGVLATVASIIIIRADLNE